MSSAYWSDRIAEIEQDITNKTNRLNTVNAVKANLYNNYDESIANVNLSIGYATSYMLSGIEDNQIVYSNLEVVTNYKQQFPEFEGTLSTAVTSLASESGSLEDEIAGLQVSLQSAWNNYYYELEQERIAREAAEAARAAELARALEAARNSQTTA